MGAGISGWASTRIYRDLDRLKSVELSFLIPDEETVGISLFGNKRTSVHSLYKTLHLYL